MVDLVVFNGKTSVPLFLSITQFTISINTWRLEMLSNASKMVVKSGVLSGKPMKFLNDYRSLI